MTPALDGDPSCVRGKPVAASRAFRKNPIAVAKRHRHRDRGYHGPRTAKEYCRRSLRTRTTQRGRPRLDARRARACAGFLPTTGRPGPTPASTPYCIVALRRSGHRVAVHRRASKHARGREAKAASLHNPIGEMATTLRARPTPRRLERHRSAQRIPGHVNGDG